VIRTRVGYCGGTTRKPTYYSMGDHSESMQVDFDPARISYAQLLELARVEGNFGGRSFSRQYRSVVLYHNEEQRQAALKIGLTAVEPLGEFTRAEDYHQKYYLKQSALAREFYRMFPEEAQFTDSTAVARANGIVGGHATAEDVERWLPRMGVSASTAQSLRQLAGRNSRSGCALPP